VDLCMISTVETEVEPLKSTMGWIRSKGFFAALAGFSTISRYLLIFNPVRFLGWQVNRPRSQPRPCPSTCQSHHTKLSRWLTNPTLPLPLPDGPSKRIPTAAPSCAKPVSVRGQGEMPGGKISTHLHLIFKKTASGRNSFENFETTPLSKNIQR